MNPGLRDAFAFIGRVLLAAIFLMSGVNKFTNWEGTAAYMHQQGMPAVPFFLTVAALCEIVGGLLILLGWWTRIGAGLLIIMMIPTTLIFHAFWGLEPAEQQMQMTHFMKNLAILGGLCTLLAHGPGRWSVDQRHESPSVPVR